jgi:hypothetical protein
MAPLVYKEEGKEIAKVLWDETMNELAFANIAETIEQLKV